MAVMEKKYEMMVLLAKTGLFFAHCDGEYDRSEERFITDYIRNLSENEHIPDSIMVMLHDTIKHVYTLDTILEDTRALLEGFNKDECRAIIQVIKDFITRLIVADGRIDSNEQQHFNEWMLFFKEYCD